MNKLLLISNKVCYILSHLKYIKNKLYKSEISFIFKFIIARFLCQDMWRFIDILQLGACCVVCLSGVQLFIYISLKNTHAYLPSILPLFLWIILYRNKSQLKCRQVRRFRHPSCTNVPLSRWNHNTNYKIA